MSGLSEKERADATAAEPDVHRCACGHAPKWHHDTRGCGYYGHAPVHRCPCALTSDESIGVLVAAARADVLAKVEASRLNLSHIIHRFDCEWTDECSGPNFNDERLADQIIAALVADLGSTHD